MQYNFEIRTAFNDDELQKLVNEAGEGLVASSQLVIGVKIRVNTELPDEKVELLRQALAESVADKLGSEDEVVLVSQEH